MEPRRMTTHGRRARAALIAATPLAALAAVTPAAFAGDFESRFDVPVGTTSFGDGSVLAEAPRTDGIPPVAGVRDDAQRELQLTDHLTGGTRSAYRLPDLDPGRPITAFSARWNAQLFGGFLGDGFSLSFGNLPSDLTSDAYRQEDGFGSGLTVAVRTTIGTTDQTGSRGLRAYVNGAERSFANGPNWGSGNFVRNYFEVDWNAADGLTLRVNGQTYIDRASTNGFTPAPGMTMAFAGRTSAILSAEEVRLDNLAVVTGGNLRQVAVTNPTASSHNPNDSSEGAASAFDNKPGFTAVAKPGNPSPTNNTKWLMFNHVGTIGARTADGLPHAVTAYTIVSGNDAPERYPRDWTLQGSTDGVNWSTVDTVTGEQSLYSINAPRAYVVDDPGLFTSYRLAITQNNRGTASDITQISDIVLYETAAVPEPAGFGLLAAGAGLVLIRRRRPERDA